jgi:catechol 2,3-dioxygenase-like lactoylglutathione lyase family enzyme
VQLSIPPGGEERARAFWAGPLALREVTKPPVLAARGGCWFRGDGIEVHCGVEADFAPARKAHPGLLVAGLRELAERLVEHGVAVLWDADFPGYDRFHAHDPFGNRLEFLEAQPEA